MAPSAGSCSTCIFLMLLVACCSRWIPLGTGGLSLTDHRQSEWQPLRQRAVVEQPSHISCPTGERTSSALPAGRVSNDRRPDGSRLRIATFNVEWLFDGIDDNPKFVPWQGAADADAHLQNVADAVGALDADILNLIEVEGCFMLHRLINTLPQARQRVGYVPYVIPGSVSASARQRCWPYLCRATSCTCYELQTDLLRVWSQDSGTRQQIGLLSRLEPKVSPQRTEQREPYPRARSRCGQSRSYNFAPRFLLTCFEMQHKLQQV